MSKPCSALARQSRSILDRKPCDILRRRLLKDLGLPALALLPLSLEAQASESAARDEAWPLAESLQWFQGQSLSYRLRGQANMRWFGLLLYEARLWTLDAFDSKHWADQRFALELVYARSFDGAKIAQASLELMQAQHGKVTERDRQWLAWMQQSFPNIQAKDRLLGLHQGAKEGCRFVHNRQVRLDIPDAQFAKAFFGIWLDPRTTEPALR
ncbi:MAG: chalcone isomerase family protein, partial [Burkholderiaceae bacterium]